MSAVIIHHNDLDGYTAGTIIHQKYPDAVCFSVNYDNPEFFPDIKRFGMNDTVFMVDYTHTDDDVMQYLIDNTDFIWIDHHITSIEKEKKNHWEDVDGIRRDGSCGAELCWEYLYEENEMPDFIWMVGNYDIFRYSHSDPDFHENQVIPFALGAASRFEKIKPENFGKDGFMFNSGDDFKKEAVVDELIHDGKIILNYQKEHGRLENPCNCFVKNLWGLRFLCMNSCGRGSTQFTIPGTWNPELHDAMLIYYYNGKKWAYGLYTEKPEYNMGKIALEYGGGGHRGAAGFNSDYLLDELK